MQLLFDFFPIIAFFAAYKFSDIYTATIVIIVAVLLQVAIQWFTKKTVNKMHLVSGALLLVFGGITLALRDQIFIQWKPTVVSWLFAAVFLGSQFIGDRPLVQRLMEAAVADCSFVLPEAVWRQINMAWVLFQVGMGALNLYVVYNFDENTWVNFKLFGFFGLTLVFVLAQGLWISRYATAEDET